MSDVVAIIAPGEMGSAVGRRLIEHAARVITSLEGRGKASIARAERAGFAIAETDAQLVQEAGFVLSIVPPGAALGLAERLVAVLAAAHSASAQSPQATTAEDGIHGRRFI